VNAVLGRVRCGCNILFESAQFAVCGAFVSPTEVRAFVMRIFLMGVSETPQKAPKKTQRSSPVSILVEVGILRQETLAFAAFDADGVRPKSSVRARWGNEPEDLLRVVSWAGSIVPSKPIKSRGDFNAKIEIAHRQQSTVRWQGNRKNFRQSASRRRAGSLMANFKTAVGAQVFVAPLCSGCLRIRAWRSPLWLRHRRTQRTCVFRLR